jgi:uncharacterized lipoprotein YmbA
MVVTFGCTVLPPKPDRTQFIVLAPITSLPKSAPLASPNLSSLAIGLGPIQLPQYLDHPDLLIRTSPNGFELSERTRWAEPLPDDFRRVLASDLTHLLGTSNIVQYPWYPGTRLDYIVHIEVQRFEADTNQNAQLTAHWDLRTAQSIQVLVARTAQFSTPMTSPNGDAAAAALSANVGELAGEIASAITQLEQQRLVRGGIQ